MSTAVQVEEHKVSEIGCMFADLDCLVKVEAVDRAVWASTQMAVRSRSPRLCAELSRLAEALDRLRRALA